MIYFNALSVNADDSLWVLNEKIKIHFPDLDASAGIFKFPTFTADFKSIEIILSNYPAWSNKLGIDLERFAKHLFFESIAEVRNHGAIRYKYEGIIKSIQYLAMNNLQYFDENSLSDYYRFIIMHGMVKNKVVERPSPLGYHNFSYTLDPAFWINFQEEFKYPKFGFFSRISETKRIKALRSAVQLVFTGTLTLEEWRTGGSFNSLTLDYGQFYIHHCIEFFNDNFILAAAIKKTLEEALDIAIDAGLQLSVDSLKSYGIGTICQFLSGASMEDLSYSTKRKSKEWGQKVQKFTLQRFQHNYQLFSKLSIVEDLELLNKFVSGCGLDPEDTNSF